MITRKYIHLKKLVLTGILFILITSCFSQTKTASLLSLKGSGVFFSGKVSKPIEIPMLFISGDKIKVTAGEAKLILVNGEEKIILAGNEFIIPKFKKEEMILELDPTVFQDYDIQAQSNTALTLRGDSSNLVLFPISSKLIDKKNARILWNVSGSDLLIPAITFSDVKSFTSIYTLKQIKERDINLLNIPFADGVDYTWTFSIPNTPAEQIGLISVLTKEQKAALPKFSLNTKQDYLKAYTYYYKNEFYFDAYNIIEEACKKYPEIDLFRYILANLKGEK